MSKHSLEFVESLLDMSNGAGGRTVAVIGSSAASDPYWAGSRFAPVTTLFEAVLRSVLSAPYERIVAATGHGSGHLPNWKLGANIRLGDEAMIWMVRGEVSRRSSQSVATGRKPWEIDLGEFQEFTASSVNRLIWRSESRSYWERLEEYIKCRDREVASGNGSRTLLLVDYSFLVPTPEESRTLCNSVLNQRLMNSLRIEIKAELANSSVDLVLFSENGTALDFLQEKKSSERSVIARVIADHLSEYEWQQYGPNLQAMIPHFCLAQDADVVEARRMTSLLPGALLETRDPERTTVLYDSLRFSRLNRRASVVGPPANSREVALEFWANIDLAPLRAALDEEIIGQTASRSAILGILEEHKERCATLLARSPGTRITSQDNDFCLPAVGLFGAAGMGKTTLCKIIARTLFGEEQFSRLIDLGGKSLKVATIGVEPPMMGCDDESDLINFARTTKGLGVVCFNEFTRIALPQNTTLANSLAPLLQILQDRYFEPANPKFRPPSRFYHLANTLFIFDGNVCPAGTRPPHGFYSIDELGPAFTRRVTVPIYFEPLQEKDYREAARRALLRSARNWARTYESGAESAGLEIDVAEDLADAVESEFRRVTRSMGEEPSIGRLNTLVRALPYGQAFDAARKEGVSLVRLDARLAPAQWQL
jgi:hypothetical protein